MINDKYINLDKIITASRIHPSRVFNVYLFGSRVYGTDNSKSDYDVIMIANNSVNSTEIRNGLYNIHIYTPDKFKEDLEWHRIQNLECIFSDNCFKLKESINYDKFIIDLVKLRHSISHVNSNSWVKCKKKLELENEYNIGIKSLFHSMRIPIFGIQIAKYGRITNYSEANYIWDELCSRRWNWTDINCNFKPIKNSIMSEFRKYAKNKTHLK